ncbi:MAG: BadF/BadG/BcrA/BcrD ATPase family protein, partial [Chloroflexota bacterium]|nr:BadF/BadG/BcrA/BcrD ATPase family protein [Chloroflexota bacterium]
GRKDRDSMTRYVLGIDGGGTKTQAVILNDEGEICGAGTGGISNYDDVGVVTARMHIGQTVDIARDAAGLPAAPFDAAFLGLAGVASATDRGIVRGIAQDLQLAPDALVGVDHDIRIALAGGLSGRPGIVQIAGTGSSCYGRNEAGDHWRSGGWGPLISDEGSGYWLGVEAMRAATRASDGRSQPTTLLEAVLARLELPHIDDIMRHIYMEGISRAETAALGSLVIEAARAGDEVALEIIGRGSQAMADCILAVARHLDFGECELALTGGVFQAGDVVVQPLREAVLERLPRCRITLAELPSAVGACLLALELLDVHLDGDKLQALCQDAATL